MALAGKITSVEASARRRQAHIVFLSGDVDLGSRGAWVG